MTAAELKITEPQKINASYAKYIKLGKGGCYENMCLSESMAMLAYYEIPHEDCLNKGIDELKETCLKYLRGEKIAASQDARQIYDFYNADADTLWVTICSGFLWWCFLEPGVTFLTSDRQNEPNGSRYRKCAGEWRNTDIYGNLLRVNELSGNLTKVAGFQGTICSISDNAFDYLMHKINGREAPEIVAAKNAIQEILKATVGLISKLQPKDFELLVELVFSQSGWRRISELGGTMKTIDLELEIPVTGEKAIVQIKSKTNQSQLDDYIEQFEAWDASYKFYIYHSASTALNAKDSGIRLIGVTQLSEMVLNAGLLDWLIKKVG